MYNIFAQFLDLLTIVPFLCLVNKLSCSCPEYWMGYKQVLDDVIPHPALKMMSIDSKVGCIFACNREAHCVAFAFHQQKRQCHLYTRNVEELTTEPDTDMAVFVRINEGSNLARLKTPSTSTVGMLDPLPAALDNNSTTCFQTKEDDYQPWFLVDLLDTFLIRFILVYNEPEYPERLHDVNYEVYESDPTINNSSEGNCCASVADYNTGKNIIRCKDGVRGRFVKISIEKSNFLTLCEVEIYGIPLNETSDTCNQKYECKKLPGGVNIALNKPTKHSSQHPANYTSNMAVDGNLSGNHRQIHSCQHTASNDQHPWWQVDLEWMYDITSVTISNRYDATDDVAERFSDVSIMVYDSDPSVGSPTSKLCKFIPGYFGRTVRTFECDEKTVGRFIRITKPTEYLNMCEVEVTGIQ